MTGKRDLLLIKAKDGKTRLEFEDSDLPMLARAMREAAPDRLIREPEVLAITGLSRSRMRALLAVDEFPAPYKQDESRAVAWSEKEIRAWVEARKAAGKRAP
jgi:prophage regulatory protein